MAKIGEKRIQDILSSAPGHPLDIYHTLYTEFLKGSDHPGSVLREIIQYTGDVGSEDDAPSLMDMDDAKRISNRYTDLLSEISFALMADNPTEEDFYQKLYGHVFASELFPQDEQSQTVILYTISQLCVGLPYFQLIEPTKMSDEEYRERTTDLMPQIVWALHILNRRLNSRTEEASQICLAAESIPDRLNRIVFWSAVIGILKAPKQNKPSN